MSDSGELLRRFASQILALRARNAELEAVIEAALRGTPGWEDAADAALAREGKE